MDYLKLAKKHSLSLIEVSILVRLNQRYPRAISIDEISDDVRTHSLIEQNMNKLISKNLVVSKFQNYLSKKDHR